MTIKAIIWDFGGVIMRTEDWEPRTKLAGRFGLSRQDLENIVWFSDNGYKAGIGQITANEQYHYVIDQLELNPDELEPLMAEYFAGDHLDIELVDWIRSLKPNYITGMISNAFDDLRPYLQKMGIADAFDAIVISAEEGIMKPDAKIYHTALERLEVAPEETVFVDDFEVNIRGALDLGMFAVHFRDSTQVKLELTQLLANHGAKEV